MALQVAQFGYVWVILLGAGNCSRDDDHIVFSVVYDRYRNG
jgi:TRAP-type C4-dicarboxylate transport system permease small subunit